jgi:hypothetical protein
MRRAGRGLILGTLACAFVSASGLTAAFADWVPPFKGNDTGGIIAWSLTQTTDARQLAIDHCARYGKVVKPLAAQREYGGYLSFACVWQPPPAAYPGAISVKG